MNGSFRVAIPNAMMAGDGIVRPLSDIELLAMRRNVESDRVLCKVR
jgi:hypothetical protein